MKQTSCKNNIYIFQSYFPLFNIISIFLLFLSFNFFFKNDFERMFLCLIASMIFSYVGTVYCRVTINLNTGYVYFLYFRFFKLKKYNYIINCIKEFNANYTYNKNSGSSSSLYTFLTIKVLNPDKIITFDLGTDKESLFKSVELMNSLIEQYKQKHSQKEDR